MANLVGNEHSELAGIENRYFYGIRRNDDGELFLTKVDIADADAELTVNGPGDPIHNFHEFEEGIDFFEGRDSQHNIVYKNAEYEQYRWDETNKMYFINDEGELVMRMHRGHTHTPGISSDDKRKQASATPNDNKLYRN